MIMEDVDVLGEAKSSRSDADDARIRDRLFERYCSCSCARDTCGCGKFSVGRVAILLATARTHASNASTPIGGKIDRPQYGDRRTANSFPYANDVLTCWVLARVPVMCCWHGDDTLRGREWTFLMFPMLLTEKCIGLCYGGDIRSCWAWISVYCNFSSTISTYVNQRYGSDLFLLKLLWFWQINLVRRKKV